MARIDPSLLSGVLPLGPDNFTSQMWGGDWIPRLKGMSGRAGPAGGSPVGESWEFSPLPERPSWVRLRNGERLPLPDLVRQFPQEILGAALARRDGAAILLKFIDARDDLSLQVHPVEKSEAWFVLDAGEREEEGYIYLGFDERKASGYLDRAGFEAAFLDALNQANAQGPSTDPGIRRKAERLVLPFLNRIRVKRGDIFEVRPGAVHAIGRGVRLFEIQQASDLTYRVWDWNRPDAAKLKEGKTEFRELHVKKAQGALDFGAFPADRFRHAGGRFIEHEKKFAFELLSLSGGSSGPTLRTNGQYHVLTVIKGSLRLGDRDPIILPCGHSALIPACAGEVSLRAGEAPAEVLRSYVPI